jgi:hypothetical protein
MERIARQRKVCLHTFVPFLHQIRCHPSKLVKTCGSNARHEQRCTSESARECTPSRVNRIVLSQASLWFVPVAVSVCG